MNGEVAQPSAPAEPQAFGGYSASEGDVVVFAEQLRFMERRDVTAGRDTKDVALGADRHYETLGTSEGRLAAQRAINLVLGDEVETRS